jgi:hypothetical protein
MFFNESTRQWEAHPDCTCGRKWRCICQRLRPLDKDGVPIYTVEAWDEWHSNPWPLVTRAKGGR